VLELSKAWESLDSSGASQFDEEQVAPLSVSHGNKSELWSGTTIKVFSRLCGYGSDGSCGA
jgi:hypothetical protein